VLIEVINRVENGPYLLRSTAEAADFVRSVGRDNVRLQCDLYHMRFIGEDLVARLRAHRAGIAHVQIADFPGRNEPGTGEIRFADALRELDAIGYRGFVGLEYKPTTGDTEASLAWLPREARAGETSPELFETNAGGARG
jgi:hydroxypyruvate isomerase